ncbi:MAG: DNA primase catalytic subunit PriS [Archaeoglobaceae archaeon]
METKQYLIRKFEEYYRKKRIRLPKNFEQREFAFVPFESLPQFVMKRHNAFSSEEDFRAYILSAIPAHIYYSSAYYERPNEENMEKKGWKGADLIFDIDADHLPVRTSSIEHALAIAKREVQKLLKILSVDFGVKEVEVFFSGGRGYHVHVLDEDFLNLGSPERREIVDYLMLNNPKIVEKSSILDSNAAIRITRLLEKKGISGKEIIKRPRDFEREISSLRVYIDAPVTADVKRLIRLPESLHGKTGLRVVEVEDLKSFDPFRDAIAFGEEKVKIRVLSRIKMRMHKLELDFHPGEVVAIPEFSAIYLLCRGMATI